MSYNRQLAQSPITVAEGSWEPKSCFCSAWKGCQSLCRVGYLQAHADDHSGQGKVQDGVAKRKLWGWAFLASHSSAIHEVLETQPDEQA